MRISHLLRAAALWALAGCGDDKNQGDESTTKPGGETAGQSETGGGTGSSPTTGVVVGSSSGEGSGGGVGDSGSSFIVMDDTPSGNIECDVFAQDCPEGQKCMPWANDGGNSWNAATCTPVNAMPKQSGDSCQAEGNGLSGVDDCDIGLICWFLDGENKGTCADMCKGTPENATCPDPTQICDISNEGVIIICLNTCNPLVQDCPEGQICFYDGASDFICDFDASGDEGQYQDGCAYINDCDYGLYCEDQAAVPGCQTPTGCCTPYCSLAEPMCPEGAMCEPWYEGGSAPPGQEDIGACVIPP